MAEKADNQGPAPKETTFRSFTPEQSANYAENRLDYHPRLYNLVLSHHQSTGGQLDTLLDVGCGPGTAVRSLASVFNHALGIDPSEGMITTARSIGGVTHTDETIRFEACTIDDVSAQTPTATSPGPLQAAGSVDLITAATAAHWFDMAVFWPRAARLLKPGGSVALWVSGPILVDPSMPGGVAIQAAIDGFEQALDAYMVPGNRVGRGLYVDLTLPWMLEAPVPEFERDSFLRKEWDVGEGKEPIDEFYRNQRPPNVDVLVMVLATASPYIRWREANAGSVGTEADPLQVMRKEIEKVMQDAGMDPKTGLIEGGVGAALLMVKKKAD
ncbi:S-adenosyl-L-methionine-dependent methyltransferase [Chaetomium fimeti]|uniref:S-adenosyl-L-methionine-dependent methyltransferase n=1 Tax=Chaetomium fimeti TaxID=1854472 RepID=A0AAE0HC73_9PEZI|nr:S-adenosyl-L-methionine-dependent methyltransferase [Chaetomium fimeti]